jgi:hypothetical protein
MSVAQIYSHGEQPLVHPRTPVQLVYTAQGPVYVPIALHTEECQPIKAETRRVIRRQLHTPDGRTGVEITEEHDVTYAPPRRRGRTQSDAVRVTLAAVVSFIAVSIAFTMFGGATSEGFAALPVYWVSVGVLWWSLS